MRRGSDDSSSSGTSATTATDTDSADDAKPADDETGNSDVAKSSSSSDDSGSAKESGIPKIADGTYKSGTATVEVSGEDEKTFDALTSGQTDDGSTLIGFMASDANLTIGFGPNPEDSNVSVAVSGLSVGGTFGQECGVQFSQNDSKGLAGEFTCTDAPAVDSASGKLDKRSLKGTFSVER